MDAANLSSDRELFVGRVVLEGPDRAQVVRNVRAHHLLVVSTQVHTWIHGMVDLCNHHPDLRLSSVEELMLHLPFAIDLIPRDAPNDEILGILHGLPRALPTRETH